MEVEACLTQLQVVVVGLRQEVELISGIAVRQLEVIGIQRDLILEMDRENWRRFANIERRLDPWG